MRKTIIFLVIFNLVMFAFAIGSVLAGSQTKSQDDKMKMTGESTSVMPAHLARAGEAAPDFTLVDNQGKKYTLSDYKGKYVVLEWINFDCPFVKKHYHSGNMPDLQKTYRDKGVVWLTICSSAPGKQGNFEGAALVERMTQEKWNGTAYLIDSEGKVGKTYQAKTTPSMYVIDPEGKLVYAGAIDDMPSTNPEDIPNAANYVKQALSASMAGKDVAVKTTASYGCSVKYAN